MRALPIVAAAGAAAGAAAFIAALGAAAPARAQLQSAAGCQVGMRVTTGDGHTGTITRVDNAWSYCYVRRDDTGAEVSYLYSLLTPAGGAGGGAGGALTPGVYECFADGHYTFMNISITGPGAYSAAGGPGSYSIDASGQITFTSGSLRPYHAKLLAGGRIGLNTNGDPFYATTCEPRQPNNTAANAPPPGPPPDPPPAAPPGVPPNATAGPPPGLPPGPPGPPPGPQGAAPAAAPGSLPAPLGPALTCSDFVRNDDGTWSAAHAIPIHNGDWSMTLYPLAHFSNVEIVAGLNIGPIINQACGGH